MARSTTPRGGARRGGGSTTKKAATKASGKPASPPETKDVVTASPAPAPAKRTTTTRKAPARKVTVKPKAAAKSRSKPVVSTRTAKAKAAVASKLPAVKLPDLPEVTPKRAAIGAGVLAGLGAALFLWRGSRADQPDYTLVEQDGEFEIREYPATTTAAATSRGPRKDASDRNFRMLADYIFAKSRPGEKLAMTAPVTITGSAIDGWTTRFFMPAGKARGDLPAAPQGVTLESHPPRRAAVVRFSGPWRDDALFSTKEGALRSWLQLKGCPHEAKAEHAAYNSPIVPGPLRRNEVLVTLSEG